MARPRKDGEVSIEVLRDGVFIADDVRAAKGDKVTVPAEIAEALKAHGFAK